ncbi:MAG: hypothetical protein NC033_03805 [Clostridiales bacterium]|nr:hypothetical protein [Clostridiales bacterium]
MNTQKRRRKGKKKKLPRAVISVIITVSLVLLFVISLLITDIFIPVKYLTAYLVKPSKNKKGAMRVNYIDADFGDCILIELPDGKNMLIDGGDGAYSDTLHILKYLNARGVDKIDWLIGTSVKAEHCGGLADIVKYKDVGYAYIPYCLNTRITGEYHSFITELKNKNVPYSYACVGEGAEGDDGYFFTFLSPTNYLSPDSEYALLNSLPTRANIENSSAVVWLEYQGISFTFASDIRSDGLKRIVEEYKHSVAEGLPFCALDGKSVNLNGRNILTAPAHGGSDNTYAPWYDLTTPEQVIISVGKSYADYPSNTALSDICNYCQPLYTMYNGDIVITVSDCTYKIS